MKIATFSILAPMLIFVPFTYADADTDTSLLSRLSVTELCSKKSTIKLENYETVDLLGRYTRKSTTHIQIESMQRGSNNTQRSQEPQIKSIQQNDEFWI